MPGLGGTRPERASEPPGRQVYRSAGARRAKAERSLDPFQSVADTLLADVRVRERCEGSRRDGKNRTPVDGNGPEALVAGPGLDEFPQQNGELARDDTLAREALPGPLLERWHQETSRGRSRCRRNQIAAGQHGHLAGTGPRRGQCEKDCEVLPAHAALAMRFARRERNALQLQIGEGTLRGMVSADGGALDVSRYLDAAEELQHVAVDTGEAACDQNFRNAARWPR